MTGYEEQLLNILKDIAKALHRHNEIFEEQMKETRLAIRGER